MPVVLKIDPRRKVVYSTFYGEVTDRELLGHRAKIAAETEFDPTFNEIVDFTGAGRTGVSEQTMMAIASGPSLYSDGSLHIIVAPEELAFQLANRFQAIARGKRRNVFVVRSRADAYKLLDGR